MSDARKGHPFWGSCGHKLSDEAKARIKAGIQAKRYTREYAKKLSVTKQGERNPQSRLDVEKVMEIRELYEQGYTQQALADMFDVKRSTVQDVVQRKTWKHV